MYFLIIVEALSGLFTKPPRIHHLLQQHGRPVLRVSRIIVQHLHDSKARIDTNKVGQLERAHGHIRSVLHDAINVLLLADSGFQANNRLVDVRHQNAVGEESRGIRACGRDLAHSLAELEGSLESRLGCLETGDDLDALLNGHGVHEVRADHAGGGGEIGGIGCGGGGDLGD